MDEETSAEDIRKQFFETLLQTCDTFKGFADTLLALEQEFQGVGDITCEATEKLQKLIKDTEFLIQGQYGKNI